MKQTIEKYRNAIDLVYLLRSYIGYNHSISSEPDKKDSDVLHIRVDFIGSKKLPIQFCGQLKLKGKCKEIEKQIRFIFSKE